MTFIDLFCGIGGFRVALEQHGLKCVFSSEINERARQSYFSNFLEYPSGDITQIDVNDIPSHDILCGGFPCQSFSIAGNRKGLEEDRGNLFFEIVRIAKHHKPKLMLLENVKNIISMDDGQTLRVILGHLEAIGYRSTYQVINSSFMGVPQQRERVYFVCIREGCELSFRGIRNTNERVYLEDVLLPDDDCDHLVVDRDDLVVAKRDEDIHHRLGPIRMGHYRTGSSGYRIYSPKGHAVTICSEAGGLGAKTGLYMINGKVRTLHVTEVKRVMGFPDSHATSGSEIQGIKQLGNAVIPSVVSKIFSAVETDGKSVPVRASYNDVGDKQFDAMSLFDDTE